MRDVMPVAPMVMGWCPSVRRPMPSGDGLIARVRPPGGRLTPARAEGLARLASRHGNGRIDLSARGSIQIRGVTPASHGALAAGLADIGLCDDRSEAETQRTILVAPFWRAGDPTLEIAEALATALAAPGAPLLPAKFGFAVDTGPAPVLADASADIRIERGVDAFVVRADGSEAGAACAGPAEAAAAAIALGRWFLASGGAAGGRGRMAAHLARGFAPPGDPGPVQTPRTVAPRPAPGLHPAGALVALPFGELTAATLAALARRGALRLTPWRMVLIEGADAMPDLPGLVVDRDDPLLRVAACPGAPACARGHAATRALAAELAPLVPPGRLLHLAGCAKGCAHPGRATVALVARTDGWGLIRGGRAGDAPDRILARDAIAAALVPAFG